MRLSLVSILLLTVLICFSSAIHKKKKDKKLSNDPFRSSSRHRFLKPLIKQLKTKLLHHGLKPKNQATPHKIDLLFLVESSTLYGGYEYKKTVYFIKRLLNFFSISSGTTRVGFIAFDTKAHSLLKFHQYHNREAVQRIFFKISRRRATSKTASLSKGVEEAVKHFQEFTRPNTKRLLVTFTSERADSKLPSKAFTSALNTLKKLKVERTVITLRTKLTTYKKKDQSVFARRLATNKQYFASVTKRALRYLAYILPRAPYRFCPYKKSHVFDECHRKCDCVYGYVKRCYRVRPEWNSMSKAQRKLFISTYKTLTTHPIYKPRYETFISIHSRHFNSPIHRPQQFLPWHRWYLVEFENLLKEVDCRVTVPYWDWSIVSNDPWNSKMLFSPHAEHGFGTVDLFESECVLTGPFSEQNWALPSGGCLERWLDGSPPSAADVRITHNLKPFKTFEIALRINLHDTVHCLIGGTMCGDNSATAPEFFLHHGFIDKLWHDAQQKNKDFYNGLSGWNTSKTKMVASPYTRKQFLNSRKLPGFIRVVYTATTINHAAAIQKALKAKSNSAILQMPRRRSRLISEAAMALFRVSKADYNRAYKIQKLLSKHPVLRKGYSKQTGLPKSLTVKKTG